MSSRVLRQTAPSATPRTILEVGPSAGSGGLYAGARISSAMEAALTTARVEADALLEQARADASQLREAAWQEGWQAGHDAGAVAVQQEMAALLQRVASLAAAARTDATALSARFAAALPEVALGIARRIVADELAINPVAVTAVLADVLAAGEGETVTAVRVAPSDRDLVAGVWHALWQQRSEESVRLIADASIEPGGCVVELLHGALDGTLPARFAAAAQALGVPVGDAPREAGHA